MRYLELTAGEDETRPGLLLCWCEHVKVEGCHNGVRLLIPADLRDDELVFAVLSEMESIVRNQWARLRSKPEDVAAERYDDATANYSVTWPWRRQYRALLAIRRTCSAIFLRLDEDTQREMLEREQPEAAADAMTIIMGGLAEMRAMQEGGKHA